jgi:hypothetical protein
VDRIDTLLFSETPGRFIVTVAPENQETFNKLFKGIPYACVGHVTEHTDLVIKLQDSVILEADIFDLKSAWKKPFESLYIFWMDSGFRRNDVSKIVFFVSMEYIHMSKIRALVLTGYGLNCDHETAYAFKSAGAVSERVHINSLIKGEVSLDKFNIMAFVGGFSWGDDHGAGVIQAVRMKTKFGR